VKRTSQLVAELQATRSPEAAVRRALERVGEEVSGILQRAHETAAQITAKSRSDAEDRLETAREEAMQITADSRNRLKELDIETDRIWAERQRIVEDAQDLAKQLLALAQSAADRFPAAEEPVEAPLEEPYMEQAPNGEGPDTDLDEEFEPSPPHPAAPIGEADTNGDSDAFDGDVTAIMPPIKPDEGEAT
jgi:cell division septum initiation protein DivIVA